MSVVGFDVGNLNCFVAVARAGGIETIANEYSERCTPAIVAFNNVQRLVGISARNQMVMNYKNSIRNFKRLIGHKYDEPYTQEELKRFTQKTIRKDNGDIGIQVQYRGEERIFSPEQIMAMLLSQLKETAYSNLQTKITDCVISVPTYYTDYQRRALLQSAEIAGLNCLKIMNETSAVALNYGLFKQDLPSVEEKPRNVAFVDLGHSSLQVSITAFNKGKIKVLATACDDSLGGRDFDDRLRQYFSEEFKKKYKLDAPSNPKAWIRLGTEVEKIKKQMSTNIITLPLRIECFMNDVDVSHSVDRATFEGLCIDLLERLQLPMMTALQDSGLQPDEIHSVEIIGGSTRIPALKNTVEAIFGKVPSTTLNQDEAVARGCAIQCAMLSHTVRVRDIEVIDSAYYPINISWDSVKPGLDPGEMEVFKKYHSYPFTKMLTFPHRVEPFKFKAYYKNDVSIPHLDRQIGEFVVHAAPSEAGSEKVKVKVKVRLDQNGCFTVHSASMVEPLPQSPPEKEKEEPMDTSESSVTPQENGEVKPDETVNENKENQNEDQSKEQPMETEGEEKKSGEGVKKEEAKKDEGKKNEGKKSENTKKSKKTTKSTDLKVDCSQKSPSDNQVAEMIGQEKELIFQVRMEKEKQDAKNAVEEYVYQMKEKLFGDYQQYVTEQDRTNFEETLMKVEDWLYDEGEYESKQTYADKLSELQKTGNPIVERYNTHKNLPAAFESFGKCITHYRKILDMYNGKDEKYSHVEEGEMKKVKEKVDDRFNWFNQKMNENAKAPLTNNPVVYPSQIDTERKLLQNFCDPIVNKPKPKAEPPKDTTPTADSEKKEDIKKTDTAEQKPEDNKEAGTTENMETENTTNQGTGAEKDLNMEVD